MYRGKFSFGNHSVSIFTTFKWRLYVYFLRFRLWLNDLYVEYYIRHFLQNDYEMEFDPEVVFEKLLKPNN